MVSFNQILWKMFVQLKINGRVVFLIMQLKNVEQGDSDLKVLFLLKDKITGCIPIGQLAYSVVSKRSLLTAAC